MATISSTQGEPLGGKALFLLVMKEGLYGAAKLLVQAATMGAGLAKALATWLVANRRCLIQPILDTPGAVNRFVHAVWSSRLGKAIVALLASIACFQLRWRAGPSPAAPGSTEQDGLHAHISTSLSLLFGVIRLNGSFNIALGAPGRGSSVASQPSSEERPSSSGVAGVAPSSNDEFRVICPQGFKEQVARFLQAQAAQDPSALPAFQLSPVKASFEALAAGPAPGSLQQQSATPRSVAAFAAAMAMAAASSDGSPTRASGVGLVPSLGAVTPTVASTIAAAAGVQALMPPSVPMPVAAGTATLPDIPEEGIFGMSPTTMTTMPSAPPLEPLPLPAPGTLGHDLLMALAAPADGAAAVKVSSPERRFSGTVPGGAHAPMARAASPTPQLAAAEHPAHHATGSAHHSDHADAHHTHHRPASGAHHTHGTGVSVHHIDIAGLSWGRAAPRTHVGTHSQPSSAPARSSSGGSTGLRKNPESILGLRQMGLEGWQQASRDWQRIHVEEQE